MYSSNLGVTMSIRLSATTILAILFFCVAPSPSQTTLGTITGLVTDSTAAVVPNAVVVATNTATGAKAQTLSSSTGNYVIPNLPVGQYQVGVAITGFKAWTRSGINVTSNDNLRIDVTLDVGQTSERVDVSAEAPPLKTESTEVSTTMENKLVNDMPLAVAGIDGGMRNAFQIMMMMAQLHSRNGET